jgi:hypothetical protein
VVCSKDTCRQTRCALPSLIHANKGKTKKKYESTSFFHPTKKIRSVTSSFFVSDNYDKRGKKWYPEQSMDYFGN